MQCKAVEHHEHGWSLPAHRTRGHERRPGRCEVRERRDQAFDVVIIVRGRERDTQSRTPARYGRRPDRGHPQPQGKQRVARRKCRCFVAGHDRLDRRVGRQQLVAELGRGRSKSPRVREHAFAPPALLRLDGECRACGCGERRRHRGGVDIAATALDQRFDQCFAARDEGAEDAERLAKRTHQDRHLRGGEPGGFERAASGGAQDAEAVRIVDHEPRVMRLAHGSELGQGRDIAVHAEHAVGCDHRPRTGSRPTSSDSHARSLDALTIGLEAFFQSGRVAMGITREARATCEPRVEQRGVVQPVLENTVAAAGERPDHREVGHVAG